MSARQVIRLKPVRYGAGQELQLELWNPKTKERTFEYGDLPFPPYCFCVEQDVIVVNQLAQMIDREAEVERAEAKLWNDEALWKITMSQTWMIGQLRKEAFFQHGIKLHEADIPYKYNVWKHLNIPVADQRPIYVDIEIDPRLGAPDMENTPARVLAFCGQDLEGNEYYISEKDEYKLFDQIEEVLRHYTLVFQWSRFDIPYLQKRCKKLGRRMGFINIQHIDLMKTYLHVVMKKRGAHYFISLAAAAKREGIEMEDFGAKDDITLVWRWFETDSPRLRQYNTEDVKITRLIDERRLLREGHLVTSKKLNIPVEDTIFMARINDFAKLKIAYNRKPRIVFPCKPVSFLTPEEKVGLKTQGSLYRAAVVFKAQPGAHRWVALLDFKTIYPSIMRWWNIGLDSLSEFGEIRTPVARFKSSPKSINREYIELFWSWRDELTEIEGKTAPNTPAWDLIYARRRWVKLILNASYGVYGSMYCRYFLKPVVESITLTQQALLKELKRLLESLGYNVNYGDTDSAFVILRNPKNTAEEALREAQGLCKLINEHMQDFCKREFGISPEVEIDIDRIYTWFFMQPGYSKKGTKKKYVGDVCWEGGHFCNYRQIKGFEVKKRDWTVLAKEVQSFCFDLIKAVALGDLSKREQIQQLKQYRSEVMAKLFSGELDSKLVIRKQLSRPVDQYKAAQPHVRAARKLKKLGLLKTHRDPIPYVFTCKVKEGKKKFMDVEPVVNEQIPKIFHSGYQYYWKGQVLAIIERLGLAEETVPELITKYFKTCWMRVSEWFD